MAGTVKLYVPPDELDEEMACGVRVTCAELAGSAVAVTEGLAAVECRWVCEADGDELGVSVRADVGAPARADDDPLTAAADGAAGGVDPLVPHAARPTPPMATAMITAGIRHVRMLVPSVK
jgi:hypothetical protein